MRVGEAGLSRQAHNLEIAGSNPAPATKCYYSIPNKNSIFNTEFFIYTEEKIKHIYIIIKIKEMNNLNNIKKNSKKWWKHQLYGFAMI